MADLTQKAAESARSIELALNRHGRGALFFSGGKDSILMAHLAEPFKDRIDLVFANTGAHLPHMVEFVRAYGQRFRLIELTSDYADRVRRYGPPSMIVPVYNTALSKSFEFGDQERFVVSDWIGCCGELRGKPMLDYIQASRTTLAIVGQRRDEDTFVPGGGAIERLFPLWNWTNAEVHEYARTQGLQLPEQYAEGVNASLDCGARCTARLDSPYRAWLKKRYPEISASFEDVLSGVYGAVANEWQRLQEEHKRP